MEVKIDISIAEAIVYIPGEAGQGCNEPASYILYLYFNILYWSQEKLVIL